jgi:hypothetical protein
MRAPLALLAHLGRACLPCVRVGVRAQPLADPTRAAQNGAWSWHIECFPAWLSGSRFWERAGPTGTARDSAVSVRRFSTNRRPTGSEPLRRRHLRRRRPGQPPGDRPGPRGVPA